MKAFLTGIAGILIGLFARDLWHTFGPSADALGMRPSSALRVADHDLPACTFDWARMRAELHAAQIGDRAGKQPQPSAPQAETPPTPEQKQALAAEAKLLENAIQAGVWRDEDAVKLRLALSQMAPQDRFGALNAVHRAINQGQLKVEAQMPF